MESLKYQQFFCNDKSNRAIFSIFNLFYTHINQNYLVPLQNQLLSHPITSILKEKYQIYILKIKLRFHFARRTHISSFLRLQSNLFLRKLFRFIK